MSGEKEWDMASAHSTTSISLRTAAVGYFLRNFPRFRKSAWRGIYEAGARSLRADDYVFMNLGYADEVDPALAHPIPTDYFSQRLYERVIGSVSLSGKRVLEVGCGRGGGTAHVHAKFSPGSIVGVDLAPGNIECCNAHYAGAGLDFQVGDAMALPFESSSFDVVVNVESSHCYPSRSQFFSEVVRVLRPGGYFCFADLVWPFFDGVAMNQLAEMLSATGLSIIEQRDISPNVVRSRMLMSEDQQFAATLNRWLPPAMMLPKKVRNEAYFLPGSFHYDSLVAGTASYWRWILQKPLAS